jgi:hypothetical protein
LFGLVERGQRAPGAEVGNRFAGITGAKENTSPASEYGLSAQHENTDRQEYPSGSQRSCLLQVLTSSSQTKLANDC